jgi:hypothetical protein
MASDQAPSFYLLKLRLPAAESADLLGRVIKNFQDPTFDLTPVSPSTKLTRAKYLLAPQYDDSAVLTAKACRDDRFATRIEGLLGLSRNSRNGGTAAIKSPRIITRRLKLERDYFNDLKAVPEVRTKILEMCPMNSKVSYLVVGTMSIQAAEFTWTGESHRSTTVEATLPTGQIAAAVGGVPPAGNGGDVQLELERSNLAEWTRKFKTTAIGADGEPDGTAEEVFAICCKEVTRDWGGLGRGIHMKPKQVEYRGGQHFGSDVDDSDQDDEEAEISAAEGLQLTEDDISTTVPETQPGRPLVLDPASNLSLYLS